MRRVLVNALCALGALAVPAIAGAQPAQTGPALLAGQTVTEVRLETEGVRTEAPELLALLDVRTGQPLDLAALRVSIIQLYTTGRFENVSARGVPGPRGVTVVFDLVPRHVIDRIEFRGTTGLSSGALEKEVRARFGGLPAASQADAAARAVERALNDNGYLHARATAASEATHTPERATLVVTVEAGPLAIVRSATVTGASPMSAGDVLDRLHIKVGDPYRLREIDPGVDALIEQLRSRGYYEATASHAGDVISEDGRSVDVRVTVDAGQPVTLKFTGDPVPGNLGDLVPVRREGSADEDLLEDSVRRIETVLRRDGYWKARASFAREETPAGTVITIDVSRGPRFRLERLEVTGNVAIPDETVETAVDLRPGDIYDSTKVARALAVIRDAYRQSGYTKAAVTGSTSELPAEKAGGEPRVIQRVAIDEGPTTTVTSIAIAGARSIAEDEIRAVMQLKVGQPFVAALAAADRDAIRNLYDQRGYGAAVVDIRPGMSENQQSADVRVEIVAEGPRTVLDRIIIVGNERVSRDTILTAVQLTPGQPIGTADRIQVQQRLAALGLFRRIAITEAPHTTGDAGTDILITVEESPATTIAYGGGVEAGFRARSVEGGGTDDKFELAPRATFEIGRTNLWGKNRSVSALSGISLRPIDDPGVPERDGKCCGFSEYRVIFSFREPRLFHWNADGLASVTAEQAIRNSFNFTRRAANLQMLRRVSSDVTIVGSYSLQRVQLSNVRIDPGDQLLVDRLFPQVRLSVISASVLRDTRNDPIAPGGGTLVSVDGDIAARGFGSQVGFAKTFVQGFAYHRLTSAPRVVLAGAARLGLVRGFVRVVDGQRVEDVPASQRFFSGGSTSVRGFQLDRLGTTDLLDKNGLSNGGNGLLIFNAEVRTAITNDFGIATFVDTGNVFPRVSAISLSDLRTSIGGGLRYKSPIGPLRFDVGWKMGQLFATDKRRWELHFSIGEAF